MELTDITKEILICLIENEINSDLDYLKDVEGEEREHWRKYILQLKDILIRLNPPEEMLEWENLNY